MNERRIRRKFDQEYKMEAVRLVTEGGETVVSVAKCLGIQESLHCLDYVSLNRKGY